MEFPLIWRFQVQGAEDVKARLKEVNEQFARGELTTHQYAQKLRELNRDANTLSGAMRLQGNIMRALHPNLAMLERSFSRLGSVARSVLSTLDTVNIIQLVMIGRTNSLTEAQDELEKAQRNYNLAVEQFGANSPQALKALEDLSEAQNKLNRAMKEAESDKLNSIVGSLSGIANIAGSLGFAVMGLGRFSGALAGVKGSINGTYTIIWFNTYYAWCIRTHGLVIAGAIAAIGLLAYAYQSNMFNMLDVLNNVGSSIVTFFTRIMPSALQIAANVIINIFTTVIPDALSNFAKFITSIFTNALPQVISSFISSLAGAVDSIVGYVMKIINSVNNAINAILGLVIKTPSISTTSYSYTPSSSSSTYSSSSSSSSSSNTVTTSKSSSKGGGPAKGPAIPLQHGFEGIVNRPTLFLAGEAGAEYVYVQPLHKSLLSSQYATFNTSSANPNITININIGSFIGNDKQAIKQLADIISREIASRIGIFHF
jgi:hypothetical protein